MSKVARTGAGGDRLEILSHCPGRLRVRARVFRVLPEVAKDVAALLGEEAAVLGVQISPVTGSMVISYDPLRLELPSLVSRLVRSAGLHGIKADVSEDDLAGGTQGARVRQRAASFNEALGKLTTGSLDMRTAVPGTLVAGGLAVLLFGQRQTPQWYDLMFWAFVTFVNLNPANTTTMAANHGQ
jgi:hypothetical protein